MASAVRGIDTSFQSSLRVQEQRWVSAATTMYKLCALLLSAFDRLSTVAASGYPARQRPQATGLRVPKGPDARKRQPTRLRPAIPCRWLLSSVPSFVLGRFLR